MSIKESLIKVLKKLGENNKPTYAVMAIALVKGIARPIFTMTDKHADPETKKYTALREGLTEVVAIPTYYACGELAGKVGKSLKNLSPEKQALAKHNFMFLGVCIAALFVIPALASLTIKPFMKKIQDKNTKKKLEQLEDKFENFEDKIENKLDIFDKDDDDDKVRKAPVFNGNKTQLSSYQNLYPSTKLTGMKVGGIW